MAGETPDNISIAGETQTISPWLEKHGQRLHGSKNTDNTTKTGETRSGLREEYIIIREIRKKNHVT